MAGPSEQPRNESAATRNLIRRVVFAGRFYPANEAECRQAARAYVTGQARHTDDQTRWLGGIVPHAGWTCSAAIAGQTIAAIASGMTSRGVGAGVVVVFGAIHTPLHTSVAALDVHDCWQSPGGDLRVSMELQEKLIESRGLFAVDERFHCREHAVEVELPLIRAAWPDAMVLPVEVPVIEDAVMIGRRTAEQVIRSGLDAVYLASSDLTHYGPGYRFMPAGGGAAGFEWAKDNDRRLLQQVMDMRPETIVPEVRARSNACGGGAIAAMMAACREHGATTGRVLRHATSEETLAAVRAEPSVDAVGYAAVLVG